MWIPTPQLPINFNCTDHPHATYIWHIFGLLIRHWQYASRFMIIISPIGAWTIPPTIHQTQLIHSNRQLNKLRIPFGFNNIIHWTPALYDITAILDNTRTLQPCRDVVHVHTRTFGHFGFPIDIVTPTGNLKCRIECTYVLSPSTNRGNPKEKLQRGPLVRESGYKRSPTRKVITQVDSAGKLTTCCH